MERLPLIIILLGMLVLGLGGCNNLGGVKETGEIGRSKGIETGLNNEVLRSGEQDDYITLQRKILNEIESSKNNYDKLKKDLLSPDKSNFGGISTSIGYIKFSSELIGNFYLNGKKIGIACNACNYLCLLSGNNVKICMEGNPFDLFKLLGEKNGKIFFKNILTLEDIQNKRYRPVKKIVYKCNGSLYQTRNGKNVPRYYCKTNGKDYLEQYEFIDGNWDKVCIKRLGGKDYFEIKKIGNLSWEDKNVYTALYSKKALDDILRKIKRKPGCNELKNMFFVQGGDDIKKKMKQNEEEVEKLKSIKEVKGGLGIDDKFKVDTKEIKYLFDFDGINKIGFEYSGYTCVKTKGEELPYTGNDFDNYLCFKGNIKEGAFENTRKRPFFVWDYDYKGNYYKIKFKNSFLDICKKYFDADFILKGNYCYGYKIKIISWGGGKEYYLVFASIKNLGNNCYMKEYSNIGISNIGCDPEYSYYDLCQVNIFHKSILGVKVEDFKHIGVLKTTFLAPKDILKAGKINKSLWRKLLLKNKEENEKSFSEKARKIRNLKKISLFFPKGSDKDNFNKLIDIKTYAKENNLNIEFITKKINISKNNGITTYYQFIDTRNLPYNSSKELKLPIKGWYKVYEKDCKDGGKIYGYLYLGNYNTLEEAIKDNKLEIQKGDKIVEKKKCEKF